jgi:hypothetical protein
VAVGEHGVIEVFQQLVDSGRLVSHQGGKGLLGEAGEACAALINGMEGIVADFATAGDAPSLCNGPCPATSNDFYYKALSALHTVKKRKSDLMGEIRRLQ